MLEEIKEIKKSIEAGCVSYGEIAYLQAHQAEIMEFFPDDLDLMQWAGIDENQI